MNRPEQTFVDGLIVQPRHANTPAYVIANLRVNVDELCATLQREKNQDGWCGIVLKESQGGKNYAAIDRWQPQQQAVQGERY